jgi:hypothetical protein
LLIWIVVLSIKYHVSSIKKLFPIILGIVLGVGIAGFFIIPVFTETSLVRTDTLLEGGSDFRAHFVTVPQLFIDRMWGYGASVFGPNDTISFQIGWPHWWLVIGAGLMLLWVLKYKIFRIIKIDNLIPALLIIGFGLSLFFMHNKSAFIWEAVGPLQFAQFPWRLLSISIFTSSILGGYFIYKLPGKLHILVTSVLVLITFFLNWQFFVPKDFYPWIDDKTKLSDPLWEIQQKAGLLDYLPKSAYYEPQARAPYYPEIRQGDATTSAYTVKSDTFSFNAAVKTNATLEIPILEYPVWKVFVDGKEYPHSDKNHWGRLQIDLPPGNYQVSGALYNTPIRIIANLITLVSLGVLGLLGFWPKFRKVVLG